MTDFGSSATSDSDLIKNLVAYGVDGEEGKAALGADASAFQRVMETLLANVFRIRSSWLQPFYSYQPDLEFPEAFDESISDWNFYAAVRDSFEKIGVTGFRWKDLHEPSSKQVKRHLLEIVNFARFCEWQEGKANALDEDIIAMVEQNEELESNLDQIRREFEVACGDHDDREAKLLELEGIQADEKSKLGSLTRDYESLMAENKRAQEAAAHADKQLGSMEDKRRGTYQALVDLKVNLCEDHAEVLAELNKERRLAKEYQQEASKASTQASFYAKWLCNTKQVQHEVTRTMRMLDEALAAQDHEKDMSQQLADVSEAVAVEEAKTAAMQERMATQAKELLASKDEREQESIRLQAEEASAAVQVECIEKKRKAAEARVKNLQASSTEADAEAAAHAKRIGEIRLAQQDRQAKCMAQYAATSSAVVSFFDRTLPSLQTALRRCQADARLQEDRVGESAQIGRLQQRVDLLHQKSLSLDPGLA